MSYTSENNLETTDSDLNNIDANKFVETVSDGVDENLKENFDNDNQIINLLMLIFPLPLNLKKLISPFISMIP